MFNHNFESSLTLCSKFKLPFGTAILLVSDSVPESTIHTLAEVVVPFLLGTITILYGITAKG